jgi:hypothetical protein
MAREVRHFTATIPANTPITDPATTNIGFSPRIVRTVDWIVPPGPSGVLGWQLAMGGVVVVPVLSDQWVVDDGNSGSFTLDGYPDSGAWQIRGYNTGAHPHSVFLTLHLDLPVPPRPRPAPIHPIALTSLYDLSQAGPPVRGR